MKFTDFQNELWDLYPALYEEGNNVVTEIMLVTIDDGTFGTITEEALLAIGENRVKKASRRYVTGFGSLMEFDVDGRYRAKTTSKYWADICNPTLEFLGRLEKAFGIHPLTTEDLFVKITREKVEEYPKYLYTVFSERQFEPNSNNVRVANVNILLFHNFILTIHHFPIRCFAPVSP